MKNYLPESRTSIMASLLVLDERSKDERTSRLMRGRDAIVMEDMPQSCFGESLKNTLSQ